MFIYPLDENPKIAVKCLIDFHIKKHVKSVTKLLYFHVLMNQHGIYDTDIKTTVFQKPEYIGATEEWLNDSQNNLHWLIIYGTAMFDEYKLRFKKEYKLQNIWNQLTNMVYGGCTRNSISLNYEEHTPFVLTMPEMYIVYEDSVDCFRYYYVHGRLDGNGKANKWTKGKHPEFMNQTKYTQEIDTFEGGTKLAKMVAKYNDSAVSKQEKEMILSFITKEAERLKIPVERIIYDKFEKRTWRYFRWKTKQDSKLLTKLSLHLFGDIPMFYGSTNKRIKEWKFKLTELEFIKLREMYNFHRDKLDLEMKKIQDSIVTAYADAQKLDTLKDIDVDYSTDDDDYISKDNSNYDAAVASGLTLGMGKHTFLKTLK